MGADKPYSSISMSERRERLLALIEKKKNGKRHMPKKRLKGTKKMRKLNAHLYKKFIRIGVKKGKSLDRVVNDMIAKESCSGSAYRKQRLCFGQDGLEDKIASGSGDLCDFQFEVSTGTRDRVLPTVNKLRDYRNRGQNAVFFDTQDRLVKVVFFLLSLLDDTKNPILIIASSGVLSLWKIEFSKWSESVNVVTYKGKKETRAAIRDSEFYNGNGCIKFQVLLSSPEAIVEDMEMLDHIKWELLVIDECQRHVFSIHIKKFQMLVADMKLLTVTGESLDTRQSYINYLSLLDSEFKKTPAKSKDDINTLKEKLTPFIAFECNFRSTPEFKEYWVPVHLSSMQINQYCEALSSYSRDSSIHDIIFQIQKCCDHPYLVDPALRNSSKNVSVADPLDAEINVSGKLQVLDKLLLEIKRCEKRALVLFQSAVNSEKISTGDFLDDLVYQRFGQNSYVYIPGKILSNSENAKKKESLRKFNSEESEMFICLCDYRACHSTMRLSRVDVVVLFNGDRHPLNDIKALKRITIDSHGERLTVFRLYSSFTIEEKALILAKEGVTADNYTSLSVCQQLLAWGASYLFNKLENSTASGSESFMNDLVNELSSMLNDTGDKTGPTNGSLVSNAHMQNGAYSGSILLFGETESHTKESYSWSNLIKLTQHGPKSSSCTTRLPRRVSKSTRSWFEVENQDFEPTSSQVFKKARKKRARTRTPVGRQRLNENVTEEGCTHQGDTQRESPSFNLTPAARTVARTTTEGQPSQTEQPTQACSNSTPLGTEVERIQKECEQLTKSFQEKESMLQSEREKEISEINKKYDALILDTKTSYEHEIKIRQDYQKLVNANKLLGEILAEKWQDTLNLKRPQKETRRPLTIQQIPASALIRRENHPCLAGGLSGQSLARSVLRAPAPHLRSNPSIFAASHNRPAIGVPFVDSLPNPSST